MSIVGNIERIDIKPGMRVSIVLKADQRSGKLTEGIVKDLLTRSAAHPHGIKVRLESGQVGRLRGSCTILTAAASIAPMISGIS
jgi:uncharacterized repeat protein (TIGR03833 family)